MTAAPLTVRTPAPHRRSTAALALGVPVATTAIAATFALAWRDRLPDPVASHWGPQGTDGTSSLPGLLVPLAAMTLALALVLCAVGWFWGHAAMTRRFAVGAAVWLGVFINALLVLMLHAQLDVARAQDARDLGPWLGVVIGGAVVLAGLAAWLVPGDDPLPSSARVPDGAARLALPESEHASWVRSVRAASPVWTGLAAVAFALLIGATTREGWLAGVLAVCLTPIAALVDWTVTVDRRGLVARSRLPRPRVVVPLEEVEEATVVRVDPLREFGGWGLRMGVGGRVGVVLRGGDAIEVLRTGGRRVVVTVDDAQTGAALLNTLAERTRA